MTPVTLLGFDGNIVSELSNVSYAKEAPYLHGRDQRRGRPYIHQFYNADRRQSPLGRVSPNALDEIAQRSCPESAV